MIGSNSTSTPDYTVDITFGCFSHNTFDPYSEWVKGKLGGSNDLQSMYEVAKNGFKLFCKSKSSAAPESYKRAKEIMDQENYNDVHPLFGLYHFLEDKGFVISYVYLLTLILYLADQIGIDERSRLNFINTISNFRPQEVGSFNCFSSILI